MTRRIAIIDYGAGNLHSVRAAVQRAADLSDVINVTADIKLIADATHIILPGVGAFADCMQGLRACEGMIACLENKVLTQHIPFLGICVGMQMLMERGFEHGTHTGLGWIQGDVVKIAPSDMGLKIPHMGWNELTLTHTHPLTKGIPDGTHAYFVHSYMVQCTNPMDVLATTSYGGDITAIIGSDNIVATQFHPEKSQWCGAMVLENFLDMR